jgi:hypothetical protein
MINTTNGLTVTDNDFINFINAFLNDGLKIKDKAHIPRMLSEVENKIAPAPLSASVNNTRLELYENETFSFDNIDFNSEFEIIERNTFCIEDN